MAPRPTGEAATDTAQPPSDPQAFAHRVCLRLLTLAPRTRAQLADALRRRGVSDEIANAVLDRLTDARLVDDAAFARAWVESRHHGRGLSRRLLAAELHRRGVADSDVRNAVEALDPDEEVATARRLLARKLAVTRGLPPATRVRRLAGVLARRGYPLALVHRLVREALEQEAADHAASPADPAVAGFLDQDAWLDDATIDDQSDTADRDQGVQLG